MNRKIIHYALAATGVLLLTAFVRTHSGAVDVEYAQLDVSARYSYVLYDNGTTESLSDKLGLKLAHANSDTVFTSHARAFKYMNSKGYELIGIRRQGIYLFSKHK